MQSLVSLGLRAAIVSVELVAAVDRESRGRGDQDGQAVRGESPGAQFFRFLDGEREPRILIFRSMNHHAVRPEGCSPAVGGCMGK
jgi:hypothetical protein